MARTVSDSVTVGTAPFNGAFVYGWAASRFSSRPAEGAAPPSGSPDAGPVVTGPVWGGEGAFDIVLPDVDCYLQVVVGTQVAWGRSPATGGGGITWPLTFSGYMRFEPNGFNNNTLTLGSRGDAGSTVGGLFVDGGGAGQPGPGVAVEAQSLTGLGSFLFLSDENGSGVQINSIGDADPGNARITLNAGNPGMGADLSDLFDFLVTGTKFLQIGTPDSAQAVLSSPAGDMSFQPDGFANDALLIQQDGAATNGFNIICGATLAGVGEIVEISSIYTIPLRVDRPIMFGPVGAVGNILLSPNTGTFGGYAATNPSVNINSTSATDATLFITTNPGVVQLGVIGAMLLEATSHVLIAHGFAVWNHASPVSQPTTPVTLGDVIGLLQSYGFCA